MRATFSRRVAAVLFSAVLITVSSSRAATTYDESVDGDISDDRLAPTSFTLASGSNVISSSTTGFDGGDLDYFTINLPEGGELTNLLLQSFESSGDSVAFIAVQEGDVFTASPDDAFNAIGSLLGYSHFGPGAGHSDGADILPDISVGAGSMGFTPPLSGPSYTFWLQQTGSETTYALDFVVSGGVVPEPASWVLACFAGVAFLTYARRRVATT